MFLLVSASSTKGYSSGFGSLKDSKYTVVLIRSNDAALGTGFWYSSDNWAYLITAKRVIAGASSIQFFSYPQGYCENIPDEYSIDLATAAKNGCVISGSGDVVAVRIGKFVKVFQPLDGVTLTPPNFRNYFSQAGKRTTITFSKAQNLGFDGFDCAEDIVLFGFPSPISRPAAPFQADKLDPNAPLFRKGVIAGKNTENGTFIIDGAANWSNSGCPVLLTRSGGAPAKEFFIIGVITEYIPYVSVSKYENNRVTNITSANTGNAVVEPIGAIIQLIENSEK